MMHIGFITPEYPNERLSKVGGLGTSIKNLAISLIQHEVKVTVFVVNQDIHEVFDLDGITIHAIKNKKRTFAQWYFNRRQANKYINHIVRKSEIDVLEAPDWSGITAFMRFRCPLVIRIHGSDTYFCNLEKRKQKLKNRLIESFAIKDADAYIAPTNFAGNLTKELFKIRNKTIKVIHHGLFLEKFQVDPAALQDPDLVLYLGTLVRKKGVFELVDIFNSVLEQRPNSKLMLIGNDSADWKIGSSSTWELMKTKFSEHALANVTYKGKVPYDEVHTHISNAKVCVFPTFAETFGMVTMESMALQKPVVNSDFGWAQELMEDGKNGFLVNPLDTETYASRIIELLENHELANRLGTAARARVEGFFNLSTLVMENIQFYESMVNKR